MESTITTGEPQFADPAQSFQMGAGQFDAKPPGPQRGSRKKIIIAAAAVVVLAAGGVTAWELHGHTAKLASGTPHSSQTPTTPAPTASSAPQPSPTPSPVPSPTPSPTGIVASNAVTIAPGVAQQPGAQQVAAFLQSYLKAINDHSFQEYAPLFDPQIQQSLTPQAFTAGYRSTVDSGATLTGLSTTDTGNVAADMSFTSHQHKADSTHHTGCTNWNITLYLEPQSDSSFLIGQPPANYRSSSQPC